jgi:hypothetical protein
MLPCRACGSPDSCRAKAATRPGAPPPLGPRPPSSRASQALRFPVSAVPLVLPVSVRVSCPQAAAAASVGAGGRALVVAE